MINIYMIVLSILFGIGYANDTLIQVVKLASAKNDIFKLSYYFSKLTLINRFSIALFMPLLGLFIDTQNNFEIYKLLIILLILGLLLVLLFYLIFGGIILRYFNIPFFKPSFHLNNKLILVPLLANLFLLMGALFPIAISGLFNDFRATSMQTGIVFNFIGTLLLTFIIDKKIAKVSEGTNESSHKTYSDILYSAKIYAVLISFIVTLICFLVFT